MIGVSSSIIMDSLGIDCIIPGETIYIEGCQEDVKSLNEISETMKEKELLRCISRVRYTFSLIRSTKLVYEGKNYVYLIPCLMYYQARYGDKWINEFNKHVKNVVEPFYDIPIVIEEAELRKALKYRKRIPGYYVLKAITKQLAIVNTSITSLFNLVNEITLRDGNKVNTKDYLTSIIRETTQEGCDTSNIRKLEFKTSNLLNMIQGRTYYTIELLIGLLTMASFSQRPWKKPTPRLFIRYIEISQDYYRKKLNRLRQKSNETLPDTRVQTKLQILENLERILKNISKLLQNTQEYIDNNYSLSKINKNTRSAANKILTTFIASRLTLSSEIIKILTMSLERIISKQSRKS